MKELDLLLERFAREDYPQASTERRGAFERLLELPDPALAGLLLEGTPTGDTELERVAALVAAPGRR